MILGGTFKAIPTTMENGFVPTIETLRAMFAQNTSADGKTCNIRSIVLCFPDNPAGTSITTKQAKDLADFLDEMLTKFDEGINDIILEIQYILKN
jgi:aspartate/methionine/tyrosine aminotransferase